MKLMDRVRKLILVLIFSLSMTDLMCMYRFERCDYILPGSLSDFSLVFLLSGDFALISEGNVFPISKRNVAQELIEMDFNKLMFSLGVVWEIEVNGRRFAITRTCHRLADMLVEAGLPVLSREFGELAAAQMPRGRILRVTHNQDNTVSITLEDRED